MRVGGPHVAPPVLPRPAAQRPRLGGSARSKGAARPCGSLLTLVAVRACQQAGHLLGIPFVRNTREGCSERPQFLPGLK